jgi:hypothetical protein
MTCTMERELGAYVLHALEPEEAEAVQMHLGDCPRCRDEVGSLSFATSLLALLTLHDVEQIERADSADSRIGAGGDDASSSPASSPAPAIARRAEGRGARRRSPRRALIAVGVAAVILVASSALGAARVLHPGDGAATPTVIRAVDARTNVSAAVSLSSHSGGTDLRLTLAGAYPTGWCSLVAHSRDGRADTAATWVADARGAADVTGATPIPTAELTELDVVSETGQLLVRIPMPSDAT